MDEYAVNPSAAFVEMVVSRIRIDERRGEQVIVLKEREGDRILPIIIGISEVTAIKMKISGIEPPRPLTHDLLNDCIQQMGGRLQRVLITKLEFNTFFAALQIELSDGHVIDVDARPSDGIAVALRAEAPIYVADEVLKQVASGLGL
jgi:bifunctional DNase/RNase